MSDMNAKDGEVRLRKDAMLRTAHGCLLQSVFVTGRYSSSIMSLPEQQRMALGSSSISTSGSASACDFDQAEGWRSELIQAFILHGCNRKERERTR
jgi:hypothetical protein